MSADRSPPLAIIGLGCLFPGSHGRAGFWANIVDGIDAIRDVPDSHWRAADYFDPDPKTPDKVYAARGGFIDPVPFRPAEFGIAPTNLEATDSSQLLGLLVAQQALDDCGYTVHTGNGKKHVERSRVSVILGVTGTLQLVIPLGARLGHPLWRKALREAGVEDAVAEDVVQRIADGYIPWQENSFPGLLGNVVAGRIANRLDLGGTNCVVDAACASSLGAIHLAGMELATGRADVVLTGGVDCFNDIFMFTCFSKTPALSPTGNAKPFDSNGDGTVLGEGLGVIVLKRLEDARRDGDRVYAVLKGIGSSSDGKGGAIYAPRREGQMEALRNAYRAAGVSPATVELVEAHGTGTKVGDATEISALADVYRAAGRSGTWCAVGSIKSQIGHTKAAAGAAGLIKAALALYHKVLPPTIKLTSPLDVLRDGPLYPNTLRRPWMPSPDHPRRAALSAFGFGGSNFHCVLEEADAVKPEIDWCGDTELLAFSGTEAEVMRQFDAPPPLGAFCADAPLRVVIACRKADLAKSLAQARTLKTGDGVFVGRGPVAGKLAVLFPGQGSQYVGMLRELVCHFPPAFDVFVRADAAFTRQTGRRLVDLVYPVPAFDDATRQHQEDALRATDAAQPSLGAVQLAAWRVLEYFGVRADAFAGHSYGELVALCASGRIAEEDLARLSLERGQVMADASKGDAGAMLAVKASESRMVDILREEKLDLVLANKNAPEQIVLSGPTSVIEQAREAFSRRKISCTRLLVSAAFHSPFVAKAREPFARVLAGVAFHHGRDVFANSTAQPYPDDGRELLASQLAKPVEWVRSLEAMYAVGCRDYLEAGAAGKLTPLTESTLKGVSCHALDRKSGLLDLARALAWLASRGHKVRLDRWRPEEPVPAKKPGLTVPLSGINYVKPREARPPRPRPLVSATRNETPKPTMTQPTPPPAPDGNALAQALALTRESLTTLQRMQEQQAALHRQFLDGQDAAQRTMALLIEQQQRLLSGATGTPYPFSGEAKETPTFPPMPLSPRPTTGVVNPTYPTAPIAASSPPVPVVHPKPSVVSSPPVPVVHPKPSVVASGEIASGGKVQQVLLEVIAEKTGYPVEMLGMGMSLDADLGIDSIKRVEILSALQERLPDAPPVKPEHLGTLHTLGDIAAFLGEGASTPIRTGASDSGSDGKVQQVLLEVIAEKTGYPVEMLGMGMSLDADLGIDSIKRVEILSALQERLPDAPPVKPEHLGTLHTLGDIAAFLSGPGEVAPTRPTLTAQVANERPASSLDRGVVHAVPLGRRSERPFTGGVRVFGDAPGLESDGAVAAFVVVAPKNADDAFLRAALMAVKAAGPALRAVRGVLLTVSRMDGAFGLATGGGDPIGGALAGLAKTAGHEWPEVRCRALDLSPEMSLSVVREELSLDGPNEVGRSPRGAVTLERLSTPLAPGPFVPFRAGDLVVVSGGARGVTAEAALALAQRFRPALLLLGRSPEPPSEPDWLAALPDEPALKRELVKRLPGRSPRQIGAEVKAVLAAREIRHTLERVRQAGARALYRSVDIRDTAAVAAVLSEVRNTHGPVRGIIHGAGVLADALIADKTPEQFDTVWGTKVDGLRALLDATRDDDLKAIALFSSSTARFGRTGQVDYAMANEALNKLAGGIAAERPGCRVVSLNWGPWAGGMVTPALAGLFAKEGVGLIPLAEGAALLADELTHGPNGPREVVVLATNSVAPVGVAVNEPPPTVVVSSPTTAFERSLTLDDHPVLADHVLDGRPVLPLVLMLEWLAHAALVQNPGFVFHGVLGLRVLKGVILRRDDVKLQVAASKAKRRDGLFVASAEVRSICDDKEVLHARAEILLVNSLPPAPEPIPAPTVPSYADDPYAAGKLFHGPMLHAIASVHAMGPDGLIATLHAAAPPSQWMRRPLRQSWITEPLVVDGVFQAMILWTRQERGAASLPTFLRSYRQYRRAFPAGGVVVVLRTDARDRADFDLIDIATGTVVARGEGYECVTDVSLDRAFGRNRVVPIVDAEGGQEDGLSSSRSGRPST